MATVLAASLTASGPWITPAQAQVAIARPSTLKVKEFIATLYVPRFGKTYHRTIQEGTTPAVLNGAGLGHYVETQLPGDEGNFAIAGHRAANGGPMLLIDKLRSGDKAYLKTKTGWFVYQWLATKVVKPIDVSVIYPVPPKLPGAEIGGSYMTFTSCTPVHVNTFRIAAWFELVEGSDLSEGTPAGLAAILK